MPVKSGFKRVVIVTGAGNGLGRAYAQDLAARGFRVVVNNRRREVDAVGRGSAQRVVQEILAAGGEAVANEMDVCDSASGPMMVAQALVSWGRLDAVVANAGVDQHKAFHKASVEELRAIFDVNFFGSLYLTHAAYAHMRANKHGRIVVSTSSAGLHGLHGLTAYSASKAALIGLMRSIAGEGAAYGVHCNAIAPYAATRMTAAHGGPELEAQLPPEKVSPLVAFLISEACRVTGQTIVVGGGGYRAATTVEAGTMHRTDATSADLQEALLEPFSLVDACAFPNAMAAFEDFKSHLERTKHANHST
jgi:NAD(P)-dependent dehydrogenase (short-subunit alcohol dehydrogenase family)